MITDDAGTTAKHGWELNLAYSTQRQGSAYYDALPLFDLSYGVTDSFQVGFTCPWAVTNQGANGTARGFGDATAGLKWRFFDQGDKLQLSVAPALTFNTNHRAIDDGLVSSDTSFFLPFQATTVVGPVNVDFECGYSVHRSGSNQAICGLCVGHEFAGGIDILAEVNRTYDLDEHEWQRFANVGTRFRLGQGKTFLASVGRQLGHFEGSSPWIAYVGVHFAF